MTAMQHRVLCHGKERKKRTWTGNPDIRNSKCVVLFPFGQLETWFSGFSEWSGVAIVECQSRVVECCGGGGPVEDHWRWTVLHEPNLPEKDNTNWPGSDLTQP
jgi:hypothetical protein